MTDEDIQKVIDKYPTIFLKNYSIRKCKMDERYKVKMMFNGRFKQGKSFSGYVFNEKSLHTFELKIREVLRLYDK